VQTINFKFVLRAAKLLPFLLDTDDQQLTGVLEMHLG